MAGTQFGGSHGGDEKWSVPPREVRCTICGSDLHVASHHDRDVAIPPPGDGRCARCGSDLHTTAQHPS